MAEVISLYLGIAASWITIFGIINSVASERTKEMLTAFFLSISEGKAVWSPIFVSFFDRLFGSPVAIKRSVIATFLGFLLLSGVAYVFGSIDQVFLLYLVATSTVTMYIGWLAIKLASFKILRYRGVGYLSMQQFALGFVVVPLGVLVFLIALAFHLFLNSSVDVNLVNVIFFFFVVNLVADFIALNQTKILLDMHVAAKITTRNMIVLDVLAKLLIFVVGIIFVLISSAAVFSYSSPLPNISEIFDAFIDWDKQSRQLRVTLAISLYTTLIAAMWLWIFLIGRFLFTVCGKVQNSFRVLRTFTERSQTITLFGVATAPIVLTIIGLFDALT